MMYFAPFVPWLRHGPSINRVALVCVAIAAALLAAAAFRPTAFGLVILLLGLSWLNLATATHTTWRIPAPPDARDRHLLIFDILPKLAALNSDEKLMLWYNRTDGGPDASLANFVELAGGFNRRKNALINDFPNLQYITKNGFILRTDLLNQLSPGTRAVLLGDPAQLPLVRASLAKKNLALRILHQETVRHGTASIALTVLVIESPRLPKLRAVYLTPRNRSEFVTTATLENAIASPANAGDSVHPSAG